MGLEGREELMSTLEERADRLVRALGMETLRRLMRKTPVDTGRARANWRAGVGAPERDIDEDLDASDIQVVAKTQEAEIESSFGAGRRGFVTNALPYIPPLEDGSSDQAPQGMIKVTAQELEGVKERVVAKLRRGQDPTE